MIFKNTANNYTEKSSCPWLWCLLFSWIYLAIKGAWAWAWISLMLTIFTLGVSNLIMPFFARKIVRKAYLNKGWVEVTEQPAYAPIT